jgi:hypothetical protein
MIGSPVYPPKVAQRLPITVDIGLPTRNPAWVYTCWQPGGQMNMTGSGLLVVGVGTMIVVIPIIVGVTFFFRHHRSEMASTQVAEAEFQRLRTRFGDQPPYSICASADRSRTFVHLKPALGCAHSIP